MIYLGVKATETKLTIKAATVVKMRLQLRDYQVQWIPKEINLNFIQMQKTLKDLAILRLKRNTKNRKTKVDHLSIGKM